VLGKLALLGVAPDAKRRAPGTRKRRIRLERGERRLEVLAQGR
jgi:hypothetical protein